MSHTAYLSLGSNVGNRAANLREARERLSRIGTIVAASSAYETEPLEVREQPWFLNAVVALQTSSTPQELLRDVLSIERAMGRERTQPKGPRNIDIDILLFDDQKVHAPGLTIPHPAMQGRMFVLAPLAEIAPNLTHPVSGVTISELHNALLAKNPQGQAVRRVAAPWANNS